MTSSCTYSRSRTSTLDVDDARYPVKKTAISDPAASSELTSGNIRTRATRPASARRNRRRSPSPNACPTRATGSPSASPNGVTADSTVAWAAAATNKDERYTASPPHVA